MRPSLASRLLVGDSTGLGLDLGFGWSLGLAGRVASTLSTGRVLRTCRRDLHSIGRVAWLELNRFGAMLASMWRSVSRERMAVDSMREAVGKLVWIG